MALAGSEERAGYEGSASVSTIHAPFPTEVECKMRRSLTWMTLPDPTRCSGRCPPFAFKIVCRNLGPSCKCASCSWHAKGLRHPDCAYLRPNYNANPIR